MSNKSRPGNEATGLNEQRPETKINQNFNLSFNNSFNTSYKPSEPQPSITFQAENHDGTAVTINQG
jgi:chromosome segregation ATPase